MLFIFLLALIVFGPKKLPELARQLGKIMAEFKRATNDFKYQLESEIDQLELQERLKDREKSRAQQLVDGELTILPPPPPGSVASTLPSYTNKLTQEETGRPPEEPSHAPEQLSFNDPPVAEPEAAPEAHRGPNA